MADNALATSPDSDTRCGFAALIGAPNAGKSTLLNALLGAKVSIVTPKVQTTRTRVLGIEVARGPWGAAQIVYVDTPGIHKRGGQALNRYLNRTAHTVLADVDLVVLVVQAMAWTEEDEAVLQSAQRAGRPIVVAVNKVDLVRPKQALLPYLAQAGTSASISLNMNW